MIKRERSIDSIHSASLLLVCLSILPKYKSRFKTSQSIKLCVDISRNLPKELDDHSQFDKLFLHQSNLNDNTVVRFDLSDSIRVITTCWDIIMYTDIYIAFRNY